MQHLTQALVAAIPGGDATARRAAQQLLQALDPRDAAEAQLAAIAVAAAQAAMDGFGRAACPGVSNETAVRLRSSALAAGRAYATALRYLRKRRADEGTAKAAPAPRPRRSPSVRPNPSSRPDSRPAAIPGFAEESEFQARDRHGRPIPGHRTDLMTRAQVEAVLAYPRDPALEVAAIAEEEAMIAAQAAQDAAGDAPPATAGSASPPPDGR
ncbi:MAG TPA: hypothetical protein VFL55_03155 [Acetobacteraceae bacterium]|nr:hypothetical protein [Acetobacteraceae bacterium]